LKKLFFWIWAVSGFLILFLYNNCGRFYETPGTSVNNSSFSQDEHPWPNPTTTLLESNQMTSLVVFDNFDFNEKMDAVFISSDANEGRVIIRIVDAEDFSEQFNITGLRENPDARTAPYLFDVQGEEGPKELLYLSEDRLTVVVLDISETRGEVLYNLNLEEPLPLDEAVGFRLNPVASQQTVEIGNNLILINPGQAPTIVSALIDQDGGWSDWGDWYEYPNGTTCSKECGRGRSTRNRLCNQSPSSGDRCELSLQTIQEVCAQGNGGTNCVQDTEDYFSPQRRFGINHTKSCIIQECVEEDCAANEELIDGSCVALDDDGGSGGGPGNDANRDCGVGQAYDPISRRCSQAFIYTDIFLTATEVRRVANPDDDDQGGFINESTRFEYRIGLNHPQHGNVSNQLIANAYCRYRGHWTASHFRTDTYGAGNNNQPRNVFILCNGSVSNFNPINCHIPGRRRTTFRGGV
jgi:hypothetical protein